MGILKHNNEKQSFRDDKQVERLQNSSGRNDLYINGLRRKSLPLYTARFDDIVILESDILSMSSSNDITLYFQAEQMPGDYMFNEADPNNASGYATFYRAPREGIYLVSASCWIALQYSTVPSTTGSFPVLSLKTARNLHNGDIVGDNTIGFLDRRHGIATNQSLPDPVINVFHDLAVFPLHGVDFYHLYKGDEIFLEITGSLGVFSGLTPMEIDTYGYFSVAWLSCKGDEQYPYDISFT